MKKKEKVDQLHEKAMALAEKAFMLKKSQKNLESYTAYLKAFELEKEAAMLLVEDFELEPTRSVLFKGAASLAYNCKQLREAERMIGFGLSGTPPVQIAQELRDLLVMIRNTTSESSPMDKFQQLPENLQKEVSDFIDFLIVKHGNSLIAQ